jgi:hypothetical protein
MLQTPVAFLIFNRPDTTARVFSEIAKAKPSRLFVIADGPRQSRPGEAEKCAAARAIIERVDWDCEILKNYSDVNVGCGIRVATGISWVFEQVEAAIILEDDCLPHQTFFRFCEELLEKYRDDEGVMHIAGNNLLFGRRQMPFSYCFSYFTPSWGWASWRRAWYSFDLSMRLWPTLRDTTWLLDILGDRRAVEQWRRLFDLSYAGVENVNTWDYQWNFACSVVHGLSILPNVTLVSNIGFREDGTHTKGKHDRRANLSTQEMVFPLKHPPHVARDREADKIFVEEMIIPHIPRQPSLYDKLRQRCAAALPAPLRTSISFFKSRLGLH